MVRHTLSYLPEKTTFVFTRRTEVRLGGCDIDI